jgi:hypothetical protein
MAMGPFSLREKDRMRGRKWCSYSDPLTLALSRREREFRCPTPNFVPNTIGLPLNWGRITRASPTVRLSSPKLHFIPADSFEDPTNVRTRVAFAVQGQPLRGKPAHRETS